MAVLFASSRPLERAENIKAVYDKYDGKKTFCQLNPRRTSVDISSGYYDLLVSDEYPSESPGKLIFIGHGASAVKTFGLDQPVPYIKEHDVSLIDVAISSGCEVTPYVARQCGIPMSKVLPFGVPRFDAYFGKVKGNGNTFLSKKRAYLYAPTYRSESEGRLPDIDWKLIDEKLTDDEIFVVKPHMLSGHILRGEFRHIIEVFSSLPSTPFLIDCDVLITDYSSILFDAHILCKPVILFDKNTDYLQSRGMYFPYPDGYSSRYCNTETELINLMRDAYGQNELDLICKERHCSACDGHSADKVVALIRSMA